MSDLTKRSNTAVVDESAGVPVARRSWVRIAFVVLGVAVVFMTHFRPWEVAFLEEWPLAELWSDRGGLAFAANYFEWSLSRPLHLVPTAIGLALTGGAPFGIFLILGLVAVGQFLFVFWALRPVAKSFWATGAVALFIALHPLWSGGFLQRFLPAQTAGLALIIGAGFVIRWLMRGQARWIIAAAVTVFLGLCVYPGAAAAAPLMALVVALAVRTTWRRRIIAVVVVTGASVLMTVYSLVIARLIIPGGASYEAGNFVSGSIGGPSEFVTYVGSALLGRGLGILLGVFAVAVLGAVLALTSAIPHWAGWLMTGTAVVSPLCTIVFFGNVAWLQDVERIGYATSLGLGVALLVWPLTSRGRRPRFEVVVASVLVVFALIGAVRGVQHWQPYIALQHQLFDELAPAVHEASGDDFVVVVDHSGTFGAEYTLPQGYISSASHLMNDDNTRVWLCSLEADPPLGGAGVCNPADTGVDMRLVNTFSVPNGEVDIFISRPQTDG